MFWIFFVNYFLLFNYFLYFIIYNMYKREFKSILGERFYRFIEFFFFEKSKISKYYLFDRLLWIYEFIEVI